MKIITLAQDETLRLVSTRRGLVSLVGFFLVWLAVLNFALLPAAALFAEASDAGLSEVLLPRFGLDSWQSWVVPELAIYWVISLYLLPFFALLVSADQTASDRGRGTLRYLLLRCSRLDVFLGRFVGQLIIMVLVVVFTLLSVLAITFYYQPHVLAEAVSQSLVALVNLCLLVLPYVALMALVSVLARSARQATWYAFILWVSVSLLISYVQLKYGPFDILDWILPGSQVRQLVTLHDWQTLDLALIPIVHTVVLLSAGAWLFHRRDL